MSLQIEQTILQDVFIIRPKIFRDQRGFFLELFNEKNLSTQLYSHTKIFEQTRFVQDNISESSYGTVRGLHAQKSPEAQDKLVTALQGQVLDVIVDARPNSPTFGLSTSVLLNGSDIDNSSPTFVLIPKGCLHGFSVLSDKALFFYKCSNFYAPTHEIGVHPLDPELKIDWKVPQVDMILSDKDQKLLSFKKSLAIGSFSHE